METNEKYMIRTVEQYNAWVVWLRGELAKISDKIPPKEKYDFYWRLASKLDVSNITIKNYLVGIGTEPKTSLTIIRAAKELIKESGF